MNTKANVRKVKVEKTIEVDVDIVNRSFKHRLERFGIIPKYVSEVGNEIRIGISSSTSCIEGFFGTVDARLWAYRLAETAAILIENLTFNTRTQDDKFVYGKVRRMKMKKVDAEDGNPYYLTEFRFKVVR